MKKALLVINVLLIIAVAFLFYKQFGNKPAGGASAGDVVAKGKDSALNKKVLFAYIDMDTIQNYYELAKIAQREVKKKEMDVSSSIEKMESSFKAKVAGYREKGNTMTEQEAMAAQQDIESTNVQMMEKRQNLMEDYNSYVANKTMNVKKKIEDYLKVFNADNTFSFIFVNEPGLFYYKDTTYDITKEVLKGLNEQYAKEKK